jgi:hypothetical protein
MFYSDVRPGQFVNRIPENRLFCGKTTLARFIGRTDAFFPDDYHFVPKTFLFPAQSTRFENEICTLQPPKFIVKPEFGALGARLRILNAGEPCPCTECGVAEDHLEPKLALPSCLHGPVPPGTRFDFRIYVLIGSVTPLSVYVYREGLTRTCAKQDGDDSNFASPISTAVNKKPGVSLDNLTGSLIESLQQLYPPVEGRTAMWDSIKRNLWLSVMGAVPYLDARPAEAHDEVWEKTW